MPAEMMIGLEINKIAIIAAGIKKETETEGDSLSHDSLY